MVMSSLLKEMNIKRVILLFVLLQFLSFNTYAFDFALSGLKYDFTSGTTVAVVGMTTVGDTLSEVTIPNEIMYKGKKYEVTSIKSGAFSSNSYLETITIPNSVKTIVRGAFEDCSVLRTVTIEDGTNTLSSSYPLFVNCPVEILYIGMNFSCSPYESPFKNMRALKELTFGNSVTSIGNSAFSGCSALTSVAISSSVTSIGNSAFSGCSALTSVAIPSSVTSIGNSAFQDCSALTSVAIPSSVTSIGNSAFQDCSALTSVAIPSSVTSIGYSAFQDCSGLTSVAIPNSVTSIGSSVFSGCSGLTSVAIPNGVTTIYNSAFYGCSGLTSVAIPNSVTSIGKDAFSECVGLKIVAIEDGTNTLKCSYPLFSNSPIEALHLGLDISYSSSDSPFKNMATLKELTIGNGVTSIGSSAFSECTSLISASIGNSVASIGDYAFKDCSSLAYVALPDSVTSIGNSAFYGCSSLESVTFSTNLTSIGFTSFEGCSSLTSIFIPSSVKSIGEAAFYGCNRLASLTIEDGSNILRLTTNSKNTPFSNCPIESLYLGRNMIYSSSYSPFRELATLKALTIGNGVTSIDNYAFYGCSGLSSLTIPNSVTSIEEDAFSECCGLKRVTIEDGANTLNCSYSLFGNSPIETVYMGRNISCYSSSGSPFKNLTTLKELAIGDSITSVSSYAFYGCSRLTSVAISSSVTLIDSYAFYGCSALTSVDIPDSVTSIGSYAFSGCSALTSVDIPDSVTSISVSTFSGCSALTSVDIPNSVTSIGSSAFYGCSGLSYVDIPNSVTSIGKDAFSECSGLKRVTIEDGANTLNCSYPLFDNSPIEAVHMGMNISYISPTYSPFKSMWTMKELIIGDSVTAIGSYAFRGCIGLTSLSIPSSVTSIEPTAFYDCRSLHEIRFEDGKSSLNINKYVYSLYETNEVNARGISNTFYACPIEYIYLGRDITYDITTEDKGLFQNLSTLNNIEFGENVSELPTYIFAESSIRSLKFPKNLTSIGFGSFAFCSNLSEIEFNDHLRTINVGAFDNCTSLREFVVPSSLRVLECSFAGCSFSKFTIEEADTVLRTGTCHYLRYTGRNLIPYEPVQTPLLASCNIHTLVLKRNISSNVTPFRNDFRKVVITKEFTEFQGYDFQVSSIDSLIIEDSDIPFSKGSSWKNVRSLYLGRNVNGYEFYNKINLFDVIIGDQVTEIPEYCFCNCPNIRTLVIGKEVKRIQDHAFYRIGGHLTYAECKSYSPPSIVNKDYAFDRIYTKSKFLIVPPGSIEQYRDTDWDYFFKLIDFPYQFIVDAICYHITSLEDMMVKVVSLEATDQSSILIIPKAVKYRDEEYTVKMIGNFAFKGKTFLTEVHLSNNIGLIASGAFSDCINLTDVYVNNPTPPDINADTFDEMTEQNATLYVPKGSKEDYGNHPYWKNFVRIVEYEFEEDTSSNKEEFYNITNKPEIFDMNGRKHKTHSIDELPKGIYIINGKKTIIK